MGSPNPYVSERFVVHCVDEMARIQALNHFHLILPMLPTSKTTKRGTHERGTLENGLGEWIQRWNDTSRP